MGNILVVTSVRSRAAALTPTPGMLVRPAEEGTRRRSTRPRPRPRRRSRTLPAQRGQLLGQSWGHESCGKYFRGCAGEAVEDLLERHRDAEVGQHPLTDPGADGLTVDQHPVAVEDANEEALRREEEYDHRHRRQRHTREHHRVVRGQLRCQVGETDRERHRPPGGRRSIASHSAVMVARGRHQPSTPTHTARSATTTLRRRSPPPSAEDLRRSASRRSPGRS